MTDVSRTRNAADALFRNVNCPTVEPPGRDAF
jgi:hypothetical protein